MRNRTDKSVKIVGGSTAAGYGINPENAFGKLLSEHLQCGCENYGSDLLRVKQVSLVLREIELSKDDLLIVMVGIGDGWPQPRGLFLKLLPASWRGPGKLNPATRHSQNARKRVRQRIRHFTKYVFKVIAWSTMMFRAPTSLRRFKTDLLELIDLLNSKSVRTVLITPQKPKLYSTWIEIHTIERYSNLVQEAVAKNGNTLIHHFDIDSHIDSKFDVLLDGIHLSESGHKKIAVALSRFIADGERN